MNSFKLKSYFTFLGRNKLYTAINLFGFSVSLMVVILLGIYVKNERSVDGFHKDKERVFRLTSHSRSGGRFSAPIAADVKNRYPEVEAITRAGAPSLVIKQGEEKIKAQSLAVDSTFFDIFSFPFVEGNPRQQLQTVQEVVLTKSFAVKLFGSQPALGKTVMIDTVACTVTGVVEDFKNTHFKNPDLIVRFEYVGPWYLNEYGSCNFLIYLRTAKGSNFQAKMPDLLTHFKTYFWLYQTGAATSIGLVPIQDCYFLTDHTPDFLRSNSHRFIWILMGSMWVILLFAVINYVNLSVAQSGFRAKEAATRRLLGSSRGGLFAGFISESVLFCAGTFVIAVALAAMAEPLFNRLLGSSGSVAENLTAINLALAALFVLLLGIVSGLLPATVISRHKPVEVVRGEFTRKTKMVYSRILIAFQYCITIVLLGCTLTIIYQTHFMRTTNLGFDKENIVYLDNVIYKSSTLSAFRDQLMRVKGVEMVSFTAGTPIDGGNNQTVSYKDRAPISFQMFVVDSVFFKMFHIQTLHETGIKEKRALWLNEAAVKELGLPDTATRFNFGDNFPVSIAGMIKDFHFRDLSQQIGPLLIGKQGVWQTGVWTILVKISGANQAETFRNIKETYLESSGGIPFGSGFIDEELNSWYNDQERTYKIIGSFSLIAILISALGMLAMATYYMRQRASEIAVRKVFGSTNREMLQKLIFSFLKMVAVAFVVAVPIIWYAMSEWLKGYAYHVSLHWSIFALAGGVAFLFALIAVFWQSYKATRANPILALRQ